MPRVLLAHSATLDVRPLGTSSTELTSEAVSLPSHMVNPVFAPGASRATYVIKPDV